MQTKRLGKSAVVGLEDLHGNDDVRLRPTRQPPSHPRPLAGRRDHLLRHRRELSGAAEGGIRRPDRGDRRALAEDQAARRGDHRHQGQRAQPWLDQVRAAGRDDRAGPPQHHPRPGGEPQTSRHGLCRSVPDPLARPRHGLRRDPGDAGRADPRGQDPHHRLQQRDDLGPDEEPRRSERGGWRASRRSRTISASTTAASRTTWPRPAARRA